MEGKEVRFGIANSALFATATTVQKRAGMRHDSFTPLGGLVPLVNIMLGEIISLAVAGLYDADLCGVLSVFIAGLMVGAPGIWAKKSKRMT
jgi:K+-transporting ATPase ATPase A chain